MRLFLDDERDPPNDGKLWRVARSAQEGYFLLGRFGPASFISFDHDLGENTPTGYQFAKALCELDHAGASVFDDDFAFYVHSQNPVGKKNIEELLKSYLQHRRSGIE